MPINSYIRIDDDRKDSRDFDLKILYAIYSFEAPRISGTHGGMRRFSECIWKVDDYFKEHLTSKLNLPWEELEEQFNSLISYLFEQRHLMRFQKDEEWYHITRLAETIRTSGSLHEFQNREVTIDDNQVQMKFNIIEGTEWFPILRYGTPRNLEFTDIIQRLEQKLAGLQHICARAGGHSVQDALNDLSIVLNGISDVPKYRNNGGLKLSEFQVEAVVTGLIQSWTDSSGEGLVITADTGMGKTLAFAIPVLTDAVLSLRNEHKRMSQLILYPRTALAGDQYAEFKNMAKYINKALHQQEREPIGLAIDSDGMVRTTRRGENINRYSHYPFPTGHPQVEWGVGTGNIYQASSSVYSWEKPAQIILASIESFRRRLRNSDVMYGLKSGLQRIIFDEVHLSSGTQGGHHHFLVSRLKQICYFESTKRTPRIIGVSATIAEPRQHLNKIWGGQVSNIKHVGGQNTSDGSPVSLMHHVMFKSRNGTPMIGALVDLSSSITHQRRGSLNDGDRGEDTNTGAKKLQKTIGFSDSHQIVGDWYSFMLDNESTSDQNQTRRLQAGSNNLRKPYAHWHDRPLRRHAEGNEICTSCQDSNYHANGVDLTGIQCSEFYQREEGDTNSPQRWDLPLLVDDKTYTIKGLDTCQYLEHGKCWWFTGRDEEIAPRPGSQAYSSYSEVIRTKRFTSITKKGESNDEDDADGGGGANKIFLSQAKFGAYPNQHTDVAQNEEKLHDFVIATPTLEVGVDMDNVSEVLTHKAIRNISSYRQKVGRAGREIGSDALAVTLASNRSSDFQHYRSMRRLVADEIREPVPVSSNNTTILKHHAYEAVFDYLSSCGNGLELIPAIGFKEKDWDDLDDTISDAMVKIDTEKYCFNHVFYGLGRKASGEHILQAMTHVKEHLNLLLQTFDVLLDGENHTISIYQWLCHFRKKNTRLRSHDANDGKWEQLDANAEILQKQEVSQNALTVIFNEKGHQKIQEKFDMTPVEFVHNWIDEYKPSLEFRDVNTLRHLREVLLELLSDDCFTATWSFDGGLGSAMNAAVAQVGNLEDGEPINPLVKKFMRLIKRRNTWYLSSILETVPDFLESRPYVALPSYFTNPHEANVDIIRSSNGYRVDTATASETLRYLQPGMHTRRLQYGNRMFIEHTKQLEYDQNRGVFKYHLEDKPPIDYDFIGSLDLNETKKIPTLLGTHITDEIKKATITSIQIRGFPGLPNAGRNFCRKGSMSGEDSPLIGRQDIEEGASQMIIPKSYGINWTIVKNPDADLNQIQTYQIKSIQDGETTLNVVQHPLMKKLFSSITYDSAMVVNQLGLGVTRSNGVIIQPMYNQKAVAYTHQFTTQGLRLKLSDYLKETTEEYCQNVRFSPKTMSMLGYFIRQQFPQISSYSVDAYLDVLVENAWNLAVTGLSDAESFPVTEDDFLQLIFEKGQSFSDDSVVRRARFASVANDDMMGDIESDINDLIVDFGTYFRDTLKPSLNEKRKEWYLETCANTLGVLATDALTEFSGVQPGTIAYTTTLSEDGWSIQLFDNEPEGNGSCDLANTYFHIPIEIRQAAHYFGERNLPSESFCSFIERRLTVCMEHHLHQCAISLDEPPINAPPWFVSEHSEFKDRFSGIWTELKIGTPSDARLHLMRRSMIREPEHRGDQLELELALHLCDDGCTGCNADTMLNQYPPQLEKYVTNRGLLDELIGNISEMEGYARLFTDSQKLESIHGDDALETGLILQPMDDKASPLPVRFICHPGVGIGFAIHRNSPPLEELDIIVRYNEVV